MTTNVSGAQEQEEGSIRNLPVSLLLWSSCLYALVAAAAGFPALTMERGDWSSVLAMIAITTAFGSLVYGSAAIHRWCCARS